MATSIEQAIENYVQNQDEFSLKSLDIALVDGQFLVPVGSGVIDVVGEEHSIPFICIRALDGSGAIPAFTSMENLLRWSPMGSKFIEIRGLDLINAAMPMSEISLIAVNVDGVPRGAIPRSEFGRLSALT